MQSDSGLSPAERSPSRFAPSGAGRRGRGGGSAGACRGVPHRSAGAPAGSERVAEYGPGRARRRLRSVVLRAARHVRFSPALASNSELVRRRLGPPQREAYGPTEIEKLDIFRTKQPNAPIFFFIHGGAWLHGSAKDYAYAAETYVNAGAHYVVPDFISVDQANGDLRRDGGAGSPRHRLDLQERRELRRRSGPALYRRPFLRRASVRRRSRHRLAEGVRPAARPSSRAACA